MMTDMTTMGSGMMIAMGIYHLAIFAFAVLGIAASIKYLRSCLTNAGAAVLRGHRPACRAQSFRYTRRQ